MPPPHTHPGMTDLQTPSKARSGKGGHQRGQPFALSRTPANRCEQLEDLLMAASAAAAQDAGAAYKLCEIIVQLKMTLPKEHFEDYVSQLRAHERANPAVWANPVFPAGNLPPEHQPPAQVTPPFGGGGDSFAAFSTDTSRLPSSEDSSSSASFQFEEEGAALWAGLSSGPEGGGAHLRPRGRQGDAQGVAAGSDPDVPAGVRYPTAVTPTPTAAAGGRRTEDARLVLLFASPEAAQADGFTQPPLPPLPPLPPPPVLVPEHVVDAGSGGSLPAAPQQNSARRLQLPPLQASTPPGDCGACPNCLDKPKFGGQHRKRQACVRVLAARGKLQLPGSGAAPVSSSEAAKRKHSALFPGDGSSRYGDDGLAGEGATSRKQLKGRSPLAHIQAGGGKGGGQALGGGGGGGGIVGSGGLTLTSPGAEEGASILLSLGISGV